jgi:hypothetical protein
MADPKESKLRGYSYECGACKVMNFLPADEAECKYFPWHRKNVIIDRVRIDTTCEVCREKTFLTVAFRKFL